jgi:hypothetical protein
MVKNLNFSGPDGLPLIPRGSLLYVSTDDPEGLCTGCYAQRKPCTEYKSPKPEGCPEDVRSTVIHFMVLSTVADISALTDKLGRFLGGRLEG